MSPGRTSRDTSSDRVRFRHDISCQLLPGEGVVLVAEDGSRLLSGRIERLVAPELDGSATLDEIVERLAGQLSAAEVCFAIARLTRDGLVVTGPPLTGPAAAWEVLGLPDAAGPGDPGRPAGPGGLPAAAIEVVTVGGVATALAVALAAELRRITAGERGPIVHLGGRAGGDAFLVVLTDDYLRRGLLELNAERLASQRPWLLAKPVGGEVWVGPLFEPGRTGCAECLAQRLRGHRRVDEYLREKTGAGDVRPAGVAPLPSLVAVSCGLVATAVGGFTALGRSGLSGTVWAFDARRMSWERHWLVRRPQCRACDEAERPATTEASPPGRVNLVSRPGRRAGGGWRVALPEETFDRLQHHLSPVTGIVATLVDVSGAGGGIAPTFLANHAFTSSARDLAELRESLWRVAGGKGLTRAEARTGALCEALERYSGVLDGTEATRRASFAALGGQGIDPNECMLFSARQLGGLPAAVAAGPGRRTELRPQQSGAGPLPLDPEAVIDWSPLWSLTREAVRYLPTAYCYYGASHLEGAAFATADSNGCAAGNVLEEAVLQGFFELVERDSTAIWWYNRLSRPAVDLASWHDADLDGVIDRFAGIGRRVWALDVTGDLEIPAFAAVSCLRARPGRHILLGFGAHLDARVALRRAVTELAQSLQARPDGDEPDAGAPRAVASPDGPSVSRLEDRWAAARDWWATASVEGHPYLVPDRALPPRTAADYQPPARADLVVAVGHCVEAARRRGLETLVLDQTRPDVDLAVVRVVVPGLRHFWPRFAPGRLYDVPVELGWRTEPLDERALNPVPIYL